MIVRTGGLSWGVVKVQTMVVMGHSRYPHLLSLEGRISNAGWQAAAPHTPHRNAAVLTGASHSDSVPSSTALTVMEHPAISSEVT